MTVPQSSDFQQYDGTEITGGMWNDNIDKTVQILTAGTSDLTVATLETTGQLTANSLEIDTGGITATGDSTIVGAVTATSFNTSGINNYAKLTSGGYLESVAYYKEATASGYVDVTNAFTINDGECYEFRGIIPTAIPTVCMGFRVWRTGNTIYSFNEAGIPNLYAILSVQHVVVAGFSIKIQVSNVNGFKTLFYLARKYKLTANLMLL